MIFPSTDADCNCIHAELNTENSGITYWHDDHVGVWPSNTEAEVERVLCALTLQEKKDAVIQIESLDPALAKVPFSRGYLARCGASAGRP